MSVTSNESNFTRNHSSFSLLVGFRGTLLLLLLISHFKSSETNNIIQEHDPSENSHIPLVDNPEKNEKNSRLKYRLFIATLSTLVVSISLVSYLARAEAKPKASGGTTQYFSDPTDPVDARQVGNMTTDSGLTPNLANGTAIPPNVGTVITPLGEGAVFYADCEPFTSVDKGGILSTLQRLGLPAAELVESVSVEKPAPNITMKGRGQATNDTREEWRLANGGRAVSLFDSQSAYQSNQSTTTYSLKFKYPGLNTTLEVVHATGNVTKEIRMHIYEDSSVEINSVRWVMLSLNGLDEPNPSLTAEFMHHTSLSKEKEIYPIRKSCLGGRGSSWSPKGRSAAEMNSLMGGIVRVVEQVAEEAEKTTRTSQLMCAHSILADLRKLLATKQAGKGVM